MLLGPPIGSPGSTFELSLRLEPDNLLNDILEI